MSSWYFRGIGRALVVADDAEIEVGIGCVQHYILSKMNPPRLVVKVKELAEAIDNLAAKPGLWLCHLRNALMLEPHGVARLPMVGTDNSALYPFRRTWAISLVRREVL
jgi:hypothetical protein